MANGYYATVRIQRENPQPPVQRWQCGCRIPQLDGVWPLRGCWRPRQECQWRQNTCHCRLHRPIRQPQLRRCHRGPSGWRQHACQVRTTGQRSKFIDAGTIIKDFQTVNESNPAYALKVRHSLRGARVPIWVRLSTEWTDGLHAGLPSNDGSTPDADITTKQTLPRPTAPRQTVLKPMPDGILSRALTLPDSMSFLTYNKASINPAYAGKTP